MNIHSRDSRKVHERIAQFAQGHRCVPSKCDKCGASVEKLWPLGMGVCNDCLVANYSIENALIGTCKCLHKEVKELYKKLK